VGALPLITDGQFVEAKNSEHVPRHGKVLDWRTSRMTKHTV
jgi:hypothetical protein